ncbi:NAD-dependent succinate-semialdehyde dehydrogenase [Membranicola marinus]|uniref:NAD-dependent succinate-semialdehyde dehydrogenase n=1 Tax=Membranihabitans marinus TaxID=1227546 RepID=A0A953LCG0_9BACT|nr:NAD-dependent succinate-semialdehyde dehydrogenase [Membranihabitans marinus]MBY5957734.1 NAD-dependent succinate-semialdehyde dehydrogenase [Membranihabitans marinus]
MSNTKPSHAVSTNPYTGETIRRYTYHTDQEIKEKIELADRTFDTWKNTGLIERQHLMMQVAELLQKYKNQYARVMTSEMGKPISQAEDEVEKCAWVCRFYAKNAPSLLKPEIIHTDATESYVRHDPLGVILAVMPWNYPFWQLFRFAAPNLIAGNTAILKHASNVTGSALKLENIFLKAGYPEGVFQTIIASSDQIPTVIDHPSIVAATLTGSTPAGQSVASQCGQNIKKTVLELGGSNACVVFDDADLDAHIDTLLQARYQNTGQSCIAGKRFIVLPEIYDTFLSRFQDEVQKIKSGDPMDRDTEIGPMATEKLAKELEDQVQRSVEKGAKIVLGGTREGAKFEPTILTEVEPGMAAFDEETFGPVAAIIRAKDDDHAIELVNQSEFGLGASLFTENIEKARRYIPLIEDGAVFVNDLVKSDPRLPFGGTKISGYGRELSRAGMREFTNQKTVYIK